MLRKIVLHGNLSELYDEDIYFDVDSVAEAVRACCYQIDGFESVFRSGSYHVHLNKDDYIDETILSFVLGKNVNEIHFIPVISGSKGGGGKAILGIAMIGLAFATGGVGLIAGGVGLQTGAGVGALAGIYGGVGISASSIAMLGVSMVLGGVSQMLSPQVSSASADTYERPDQRPSFIFNGPVNVAEQGGPVPLVYGRIRTGSVVVSSGLNTEQI